MSTGINIHIDGAFASAGQDCFEQREFFDSSPQRHNHSIRPELLHNRDYTVSITVTGIGQFPVDQLRRHCLYPVDGSDAANLLTPVSTNSGFDGRNVTLTFAHQPTANIVHQCALRFASFGWSVSGCQVSY